METNVSAQDKINTRFKETLQASLKGETRYSGEDGIIKFAFEVLGIEELYPYQEEILRAFVREKRIAIRGPHGLGKSFIAAICVLWLITCTPMNIDVKVITTASAWRQLEKFLWPEIHKWCRGADWSKLGLTIRKGMELVSMALRLPGKEAFGAASDNSAMIEGAHATVVGYVFDEAKAIPDSTYDAAEGAFSQEGLEGHEAYAIAISTPGDEQGRFYDLHMQRSGFEDWWIRHVTLEECIEAGQISKVWAEQRARQWGENSPVYKRRVRGEFASSSTSNVIPLDWIEFSNERWLQWFEDGLVQEESPETIGVDPGGSGENADETAIARFRDYTIISIETFRMMNTVEIANHVMKLDKSKSVTIAVDTVGIGAGVYDNIFKEEHPAMSVNFGEATEWTDVSGELLFMDLRAMLWWYLREYLDPAKPRDIWINLPPDETLTGELTAPTWKPTRRGRVQVEPKELLKKRLKRSTNHADAVLLAIYASLYGGSHGIWV